MPIVDAAIRARIAGEAARTRAIIVYPMNALANSQVKELEKFLAQSGLPAELRPTFARYTGQEGEAERDRVAALKPDVLLTNFVLLELLMTRDNDRDRRVLANCRGLDFIVLDELHTYRGRQGADVSMLMRRVRERLCPERPPICIGTSATMASAEAGNSSAVVAEVASRLFGAAIGPDGVITESLERATRREGPVTYGYGPLIRQLFIEGASVVARRSTLRLGLWLLLVLGTAVSQGRAAAQAPLQSSISRGEPSSSPRGSSGPAIVGQEPRKPAPQSVRRAYEGYWAADRAACLNPDSDQRMAIGPSTISWYETRCRIRSSAAAGRNAWSLGLTCRGEGQRMEAHATVFLPTAGTLIMDDGPIGPGRRQRYLRCTSP